MEEIWWQIEIKDPEYLPGKNLVKLIGLISQCLNIKFVLVDGIAGAVDSEFLVNMPKVFSLSKFVELARTAVQFDFGNFYLFSEKTKSQELALKIKSMESPDCYFYHKIISIPLTTVSTFDNESFIVYTREKNIVDIIMNNYAEAKIEKKRLSELEFYD